MLHGLIRLQKSDNIKKVRNIAKAIKDHAKIELSDKQEEAVKLVNDNNVCVITGGPGTR